MVQQLFLISLILNVIPIFGSSAAADVKTFAASHASASAAAASAAPNRLWRNGEDPAEAKAAVDKDYFDRAQQKLVQMYGTFETLRATVGEVTRIVPELSNLVAEYHEPLQVPADIARLWIGRHQEGAFVKAVSEWINQNPNNKNAVMGYQRKLPRDEHSLLQNVIIAYGGQYPQAHVLLQRMLDLKPDVLYTGIRGRSNQNRGRWGGDDALGYILTFVRKPEPHHKMFVEKIIDLLLEQHARPEEIKEYLQHMGKDFDFNPYQKHIAQVALDYIGRKINARAHLDVHLWPPQIHGSFEARRTAVQEAAGIPPEWTQVVAEYDEPLELPALIDSEAIAKWIDGDPNNKNAVFGYQRTDPQHEHSFLQAVIFSYAEHPDEDPLLQWVLDLKPDVLYAGVCHGDPGRSKWNDALGWMLCFVQKPEAHHKMYIEKIVDLLLEQNARPREIEQYLMYLLQTLKPEHLYQREMINFALGYLRWKSSDDVQIWPPPQSFIWDVKPPNIIWIYQCMGMESALCQHMRGE